MSEIEILNYAQLNFIQNAIYMLGFVGLIFITFRLIRYQRENNANMLGKILLQFSVYVQSFMDIMSSLFYTLIN